MVDIHLVTASPASKLRLQFSAMRKIITLTVIFGILASIGYNINCELVRCPPGNDPIVYLPSEEFCDVYYICVDGEPRPFRCAQGTHWNPVQNICDFPENVNCTLQRRV